MKFASIALALIAGGAPALATLTPIDPFVGDISETWESFNNYNEGPFYLPANQSCFGGNATIDNNAGVLVVYDPFAASFGLGNGGNAQVSDGTQGLGVNADGTLTTITFDQPMSQFGGYWAVAHYGGGGDSKVNFLDENGNSVGSEIVHWDREDGILEWHGWSSDVPFSAISFDGFYPVADGFQASMRIPAPGAAALLGLGGLAASRRRRA
jgi:hypothetical protein